ncbi:hypothetical protein [uncultured Selenomonas sp.]|nr:hypothetical protein [uncultured Selenomonas sp.]
MKKSVWILAMVTALMVTLAGMASAHIPEKEIALGNIRLVNPLMEKLS